LIHDLSQYPQYLDPGEMTLCVICAPISVRDDRLGTISVEKNTSHFYKNDDLEILEAMAAQVAIATLERTPHHGHARMRKKCRTG
jgi:sigma-B regulation protein RsbU (phosphoserine phosphatase)